MGRTSRGAKGGVSRRSALCVWIAAGGLLVACGDLDQASGTTEGGTHSSDGTGAMTSTLPPSGSTTTGTDGADASPDATSLADGTTEPAIADTTDDTTSVATETGTQTDTGHACSDATDCDAGMTCDARLECAWPKSCAELLAAWPKTESGMYPLDPDGDGRTEPFDCDMEYDGGGWTRVLDEYFPDSNASAWSASETSECGALGWMLGGYDIFAADVVERPVELHGIEHDDTRLMAQFIKIDSWDQAGDQDDTGFARIDGQEVWSYDFPSNFGGQNHCGLGFPAVDGDLQVDVIVAHTDSEMTIAFGSDLDQPADDESWGVDEIEVWLR